MIQESDISFESAQSIHELLEYVTKNSPPLVLENDIDMAAPGIFVPITTHVPPAIDKRARDQVDQVQEQTTWRHSEKTLAVKRQKNSKKAAQRRMSSRNMHEPEVEPSIQQTCYLGLMTKNTKYGHIYTMESPQDGQSTTTVLLQYLKQVSEKCSKSKVAIEFDAATAAAFFQASSSSFLFEVDQAMIQQMISAVEAHIASA